LLAHRSSLEQAFIQRTRLFLSKGLEGYYRLCINPIIKQLDAAQTLFQCYRRFILYFYIRGLFLLRKIAYLFDLVFLTFTAKPNKLLGKLISLIRQDVLFCYLTNAFVIRFRKV